MGRAARSPAAWALCFLLSASGVAGNEADKPGYRGLPCIKDAEPIVSDLPMDPDAQRDNKNWLRLGNLLRHASHLAMNLDVHRTHDWVPWRRCGKRSKYASAGKKASSVGGAPKGPGATGAGGEKATGPSGAGSGGSAGPGGGGPAAQKGPGKAGGPAGPGKEGAGSSEAGPGTDGGKPIVASADGKLGPKKGPKFDLRGGSDEAASNINIKLPGKGGDASPGGRKQKKGKGKKRADEDSPAGKRKAKKRAAAINRKEDAKRAKMTGKQLEGYRPFEIAAKKYLKELKAQSAKAKAKAGVGSEMRALVYPFNQEAEMGF